MKRWLPLLLSLCLPLAACAPGEAWDGRVYHAGRASFRVGPAGASWERIDVPGAMLSFRDERASGTVSVYGRCGRDADDVPLAALTGHLLIGFTERTVVSQELVPLDGREALRTLVQAKLDGVPVALDVYVLKKDGCVFDLVWVSPPERREVGAASFEAFVAGFAALGG